MKILRVKKTNIFDIFMGQGWGGWSRYFIHGEDHRYINGGHLPRYLVEKAKEEVKTWK